LLQIRRSGIRVIFRSLNRAMARVVTTSNHALDQLRRYTKRRRTLRRVKHTQSTRSSRAGIEKTSALLESRNRLINRFDNITEHTLHGCRNQRVLVVHERDDLGGRL
jgi:hypothetical protein